MAVPTSHESPFLRNKEQREALALLASTAGAKGVLLGGQKVSHESSSEAKELVARITEGDALEAKLAQRAESLAEAVYPRPILTPESPPKNERKAPAVAQSPLSPGFIGSLGEVAIVSPGRKRSAEGESKESGKREAEEEAGDVAGKTRRSSHHSSPGQEAKRAQAARELPPAPRSARKLLMDGEIESGGGGGGAAPALPMVPLELGEPARKASGLHVEIEALPSPQLKDPMQAVRMLLDLPPAMRKPISAQLDLATKDEEQAHADLSTALKEFYRLEDEALCFAASSCESKKEPSSSLSKETDIKFASEIFVGGKGFYLERLESPDGFPDGDEFGFIRVSGGDFKEPTVLAGIPVSHMTTEEAWGSVIKQNIGDAASGSGGFSPHGGSMKCAYFSAGDGNFGDPYTGRSVEGRSVFLKGHMYMPFGASYTMIDSPFIDAKMDEIKAIVPDASVALRHRIFWQWLDSRLNAHDTAAFVVMPANCEVSRNPGVFLIAPGGKCSSLVQVSGENLRNGESVTRSGWAVKASRRSPKIGMQSIIKKLSGVEKHRYVDRVAGGLEQILVQDRTSSPLLKASHQSLMASLVTDIHSYDERTERAAARAMGRAGAGADQRGRYTPRGGRGGYRGRGRARS